MEIFVSSAVIREIRFERGTAFVTIFVRNCPACRQHDVITLIVGRDTIIRDERGRIMRVRELEEGMVIDAAFSSAMTRSIPPQTQAFRIRVVRRSQAPQTTTGRIIEVNTRNDFFLTISGPNPASIIRFNITPSTIILDPSGRRIRFSRLLPGLRVRVEHASFMTASIPPQTTAFVIQILR